MKKGLIFTIAVLFLFSSMAVGAVVQKWHVKAVSWLADLPCAQKKIGFNNWQYLFTSDTLRSCDTVRVGSNCWVELDSKRGTHCINYATVLNEYGGYTYYHIPYTDSAYTYSHEHVIEYMDPVFVLDGNTVHQGTGGKTTVTECGACTTGYHCGVRTSVAEIWVKDTTHTNDTVQFQVWYIPSFVIAIGSPDAKVRVWNYKNSDHSIYAKALIGSLTDTIVDPNKAFMFYDDGKHSQTAVELALFNAKVDNGLIILDWKTGSELANAGFNVYRSTSLDGEYTKLNSELIPATANAFEDASYSYTDKDVQSGLTYYYKLEDLSIEGLSTFHGPVSAKVSVSVPSNFALAQNYPNPFNASTMISYDLKTDAKVSLKVYNILGQEVTTLVDRYQPAGSYTVAWNGKDSKGNDVSTGVYFYLLKAGEFSANKKMTYLK